MTMSEASRPGPKRMTEQDRLVGLRITTLRKAKGLSQTALGQAIGVTFQQVQKYERGLNRVGAGRLSEIANLLEVPVAALFEESAAGKAPAPGAAPPVTAQEMLDAFGAIRDDEVRHCLLALARALARSAPPAA